MAVAITLMEQSNLVYCYYSSKLIALHLIFFIFENALMKQASEVILKSKNNDHDMNVFLVNGGMTENI